MSEKSRNLHFLKLGTNVLITILFIVLEQTVSHTQEALIMDIICLICAIFFSVIFITKYLNWNQVDISPFFFWALIIKRIYIIGMNKDEFSFFLFGLLNGQYAGKQDIGDQKKYYWKTKSFLQAAIIIIFVILKSEIISNDYNVAMVIILILLALLVGVNDNFNMEQQKSTVAEKYISDLKSTQPEVKKQQTIVQQKTLGMWDQFILQNDDWICKIEMNRFQFIDSLECSEQNYSLKKILYDYKVTILQLFNFMIVTSCQTNLQQSVQLWSEVNEQMTLSDWLKSNYFSDNSAGKLEIRKRKESKGCFEGIQGISDDQQSIYSPQNDAKGLFAKDQVHEISGISVIPHNDVMGSGSLQLAKVTLNCHLSVNQVAADLSVSISNLDEEGSDGNRKFYLVLVMRNIDKQIRTKVLQEKFEQQSQILFKHIGRLAADLGKLIQQINETRKLFTQHQKEFDRIKQSNFISLSFCDDAAFVKSEKQICDMKLSNHLSVPQSGIQTTNQRITSSHSHNHDSQEDQGLVQKISVGYFQQSQEICKSVERAYYIVLMLEQNNFNFYELFSHTKWKEDRFNLITTFNTLKELFKNNSILIKHNIVILQEIINEEDMQIIADKQKVKQILINIINNAIESYESNESEKLDKNNKVIKIKATGSKDRVIIEIIDNGGGIQQDQLKSRVNDCKFGLAVCQRLLRLICGDQKKQFEMINYISSSGEKGTKVQFFIPRVSTVSSQADEYRLYDSLIISNKVEN